MTIDLSGATASELFVAALVVVAAAFAAGVVVVMVLRRVARRWNVTVLSGRLWQSPVVAVIVLSAIAPWIAEIDRRWASGLAHVLTGLWLMYLTFATGLNFSAGWTLPV